jgi:hypothetical protein
LVYFCGHFGIVFPFWYLEPRKIWQPCVAHLHGCTTRCTLAVVDKAADRSCTATPWAHGQRETQTVEISIFLKTRFWTLEPILRLLNLQLQRQARTFFKVEDNILAFKTH